MQICMKSLLASLDHFLLHISNEPGPNLWVHACANLIDTCFDIHSCTTGYCIYEIS